MRAEAHSVHAPVPERNHRPWDKEAQGYVGHYGAPHILQAETEAAVVGATSDAVPPGAAEPITQRAEAGDAR